MTKYLTLLFLFVGWTGFSQVEANRKSTEKENTYTISRQSIQKSMRVLASDSLKGRKFGTPGIEKAAQYIEDVFKQAGLQPYYKTYRDTFHYRGKTGYNLIAFKPGSDPKLKDELVILGAHYDHIGIISPVQGDSIANGANDDASGTTAVLELAQYFAHKNTKRSMLFVLLSAEEEGLIGAAHLAKRLQQEKAQVYVMIEFEMIGVPLQDKPYMAYLTGYDRSNLAKYFNSASKKQILGLLPTAQKYHLFMRSDNYPFYAYLKIPAHTLSTFSFTNFHQYHQVGDEIELMNIPFMQKLIKACIPGIQAVVNSNKNTIKLY